MEPSQATVQTKQVSFRRVYWSFPTVNCPRCGCDASRVWDVTRVAIDIDLDQPIVLAVEVSVHVCATCSCMFRAQPPFFAHERSTRGGSFRKPSRRFSVMEWPSVVFQIG